MSSPPKQTELKFKPKAVQRRTQAERERIAKEEKKRDQIRQRQAAEDAQLDKQARDQRYGFDRRQAPLRGRGGQFAGRTGRGGFMGETEHLPPRQAEPEATRGAKAEAASRGGRGSRAKATRSKPDRKIKAEGDSAATGAGPGPSTAPPRPQVISDDDDDDDEYGKPRDIETINLLSDDDVDAGAEVISRGMGLMPIRMERHEHVDRQIGINTESSAATATGARRSGIKEAMSDDSEDEDGVAVKRRESKGKGRKPSIKKEASTAADPDAMDTTQDGEGGASSRRKAGRRERRPAFQTEEEKTEWEIGERDLRVMLEELDRSGLEGNVGGGDGADAGEQATRSAEFEAALGREARRDNNIFLFQLPPMMPDLVASGSKPKVEKAARATSSGGGGKTREAKQEEEEFKIEEGADPEAAAAAVLADEQKDEAQLQVRAGMVGKMRIHRSGRATLKWGGTAMNVTAGMSMHFVQTAVMAAMTATEDKKGGAWEGDACSLGQLRGKFVVTPDWSELVR